MTTHRSALFRLPLLAAGLVGFAVAGPAGDGLPRAVISTNAAELTTGAPTGGVRQVSLRPNTAQPFYAYVVNPDKQNWTGLTVLLSSDKAGKAPVAKGTLPALKGFETVRVALKLVNPPAPPPPAAPVDPKAPPAPKVVPSVEAPPTLYLHLLRDGNSAVDNTTPVPDIDVGIKRPQSYLSVTPKVESVGNGYAVSVTVADRATVSGATVKAFGGAPVKVSLDLRFPGVDKRSLKAGTYESVVPSGGKGVVLGAEEVRFLVPGKPKEKGLMLVSADGYDRAFVYEVDFSGTSPNPDSDTVKAPFVRIACPAYAVPGKPFEARLEVFNDPVATVARPVKPKLEFFRSKGKDDASQVVLGDRLTPRDQSLTLREGEAGELVFAAKVQDWRVGLDTAGIYGERRLKFTLELPKPEKIDPANPPVDPSDEVKVLFDDTPPEKLGLFVLEQPEPAKKGDPLPPLRLARLTDVPKKLIRGRPVQLVAGLEEPESGIPDSLTVRAMDKDVTAAGVLFFLGPPPPADGKTMPPNKSFVGVPYVTLVRPGDAPPPKGRYAYTTKFELPDTKGPVQVGVRVYNHAGLVSEETFELNLVDPPPPPTTGTIEGRVIQGSTPERPQPDLDVFLLDAGGKAVASMKTNDKGEFKFEDLQPGAYAVYSVKAADQNANDRKPATVKAGETTKVELELKR